MEYDVIWDSGPLGITLRPDLGNNMPPVIGRITNVDSPAARENVRAGDILISINGYDTYAKGYDRSVQMIKDIRLPATLRFRQPDSATRNKILAKQSSRIVRTQERPSMERQGRKSNEEGKPKKHEYYKLVWTDGPLGISFRREKKYNLPIIAGVNSRAFGASGSSINIGDILIAIDKEETRNLGFKNTMVALETRPKPIQLRFLRRRNKDESRNSSGLKSDLSGPLSQDLSRNASRPPNSTNARTTGASNASESEIYDIVWRDGALGLKLKPGENENPKISRITGDGNASGLHNAAIGDLLIAVNGDSIDHLSYKNALRLLKRIPKPCHLRFCPNGSSHAYKRTCNSFESADPHLQIDEDREKLFRKDSKGVSNDKKGECSLKSNTTFDKSPSTQLNTSTKHANSSNSNINLNQPKPTRQNSKDDLSTSRMELWQQKQQQIPPAPKVVGLGSNGVATILGSSRSNQKDMWQTPQWSEQSGDNLQTNLNAGLNMGINRSLQKKQSIDQIEEAVVIPIQDISLDAAKQVFADSQGLDPFSDHFAGIQIKKIEEESEEALLLRKQAKAFIDKQTASQRRQLSKKHLNRAQTDSKLLQEALDHVKSQARKYKELLANEERKNILKSAHIGRSTNIIRKQDVMMKELQAAISGFKRDDYDNENEANLRQSMINDLEFIEEIQSVDLTDEEETNSWKITCADCGKANAVDLKLDIDGQYYCPSCWEAFYASSDATNIDKLKSGDRLKTKILNESQLDLVKALANEAVKARSNGNIFLAKALDQEIEIARKSAESEKSISEKKDLNAIFSKDSFKPLEKAISLAKDSGGRKATSSSQEYDSSRLSNGSLSPGNDNRSSYDSYRLESSELNGRETEPNRYSESDSRSIRSSPRNDRSSGENDFTLSSTNEMKNKSPNIIGEYNLNIDSDDEEKYDRSTEEGIDGEELDKVENENRELAKKLEEAQEVMERIRSTFIESEDTAISGLSSDQIELLKRLTSQKDASDEEFLPEDMDDDSDSDDSYHESSKEEGEDMWI